MDETGHPSVNMKQSESYALPYLRRDNRFAGLDGIYVTTPTACSATARSAVGPTVSPRSRIFSLSTGDRETSRSCAHDQRQAVSPRCSHRVDDRPDHGGFGRGRQSRRMREFSFELGDPLVGGVELRLEQFDQPIDEAIVRSEPAGSLVAGTQGGVTFGGKTAVLPRQHFDPLGERPEHTVPEFREHRVDRGIGRRLFEREVRLGLSTPRRLGVPWEVVVAIRVGEREDIAEADEFAALTGIRGQLAVHDPGAERSRGNPRDPTCRLDAELVVLRLHHKGQDGP